MIALIDADTPIFASAVMAQGQTAAIACWNLNAALDKLMADLNMPEYRMYATGSGNFRYKVYPEYKGNRGEDPEFRATVKQHAVDRWGAVLSDGCEADDLIAIDHTHALNNDEEETCIVSIDKDFDQLPGWHYFPGITRKGVVVSPPRKYLVSPTDALRFFYYQLLVGDTTDNIKGVYNIGPKKAAKILDGLTTEEQMFNAVRELYSCDEEMEMNGACLWLWRTMNDTWSLEKVMQRISHEASKNTLTNGENNTS